MQYSPIGNSKVEATQIVFGAWAIGGWLWGGTNEEESIKAIDTSFNHGIRSFDTAPVYGFGLSEELVGKALKDKRKDCQIFTKFGLRWDTEEGYLHSNFADEHGKRTKIYRIATAKSIIHECEQSLKRLQTDYIDLYQIHWPDPSTPIDETMEAIGKLKQDGKILEGGVCNYDLEQMKEADKSGHLVSNQVPYSMLKRDIEQDVVPFAVEKGHSILAYSPLQRGLLTGKIKPGHQFAPGDHRPGTTHFQEDNIRKVNDFLDEIKPIADDLDATLAQVVIQWTLAQPGITHVLVGARNERQASENAAAASLDINIAYLTEIDEALNKVKIEEAN